MDDREKELSRYRLQQADESLRASKNCFDNGFYKDSINRSYYSAFYAIKAVLAIGKIDFKRHKDVIAYFNKNYVHTEIFPKSMGRRIADASKIREDSDYDDEFVVKVEDTFAQIQTAEDLIKLVEEYIKSKE